MKIEISRKLCPFTHKMGTECLFPGTFWAVKIFPTKIVFQNKEFFEVFFNWKGPWTNFTIFQNLEKGFLEVLGHSSLGYLRYKILAKPTGFSLFFEKLPSQENEIFYQGKKVSIVEKQEIDFPLNNFQWKEVFGQERLFLGINKQQDWESIWKRKDPKEIFPFWFSLGQNLPSFKEEEGGTSVFFQKSFPRDKILKEMFSPLLDTSFSGMMVPKLFDDLFQGMCEAKEENVKKLFPFIILSKGYRKMRELFFRLEGNGFYLLPSLPVEFFSGRFLSFSCGDFGFLDLEWSKKMVKKVKFHSLKKGEILLHLPPDIQRFRCRTDYKDRGKIFSRKDKILVEENLIYFFDCFEK